MMLNLKLISFDINQVALKQVPSAEEVLADLTVENAEKFGLSMGEAFIRMAIEQERVRDILEGFVGKTLWQLLKGQGARNSTRLQGSNLVIGGEYYREGERQYTIEITTVSAGVAEEPKRMTFLIKDCIETISSWEEEESPRDRPLSLQVDVVESGFLLSVSRVPGQLPLSHHFEDRVIYPDAQLIDIWSEDILLNGRTRRRDCFIRLDFGVISQKLIELIKGIGGED